MNLIAEMKNQGIKTLSKSPQVKCKGFEDNVGALEMEKCPKIRLRSKYMNVIYHHFREHVRTKKIEIFKIETKDQVDDMLTKPLNQNSFQKHRKWLIGW